MPLPDTAMSSHTHYPRMQYENEAIAWAERLHNQDLGMLSLKEAISLASDLRLAPIVWLEAFYFHKGDEVIFSQLQRLQIAKTRDGKTSSIIAQFVDCLKSLMNLEYVRIYPHATTRHHVTLLHTNQPTNQPLPYHRPPHKMTHHYAIT